MQLDDHHDFWPSPSLGLASEFIEQKTNSNGIDEEQTTLIERKTTIPRIRQPSAPTLRTGQAFHSYASLWGFVRSGAYPRHDNHIHLDSDGGGPRFSAYSTQPYCVATTTPVIHYCMDRLEIDENSAVLCAPKNCLSPTTLIRKSSSLRLVEAQCQASIKTAKGKTYTLPSTGERW